MADEPSAPRGPLLVDVHEADATTGKATAALSWAESENDGGAPIVEYELEMRELAAGAGAEWQRIARVQPARRMNESVGGLSAGCSYRFRVRARNCSGFGDWLECAKPARVARPVSSAQLYSNLVSDKLKAKLPAAAKSYRRRRVHAGPRCAAQTSARAA